MVLVNNQILNAFILRAKKKIFVWNIYAFQKLWTLKCEKYNLTTQILLLSHIFCFSAWNTIKKFDLSSSNMYLLGVFKLNIYICYYYIPHAKQSTCYCN